MALRNIAIVIWELLIVFGILWRAVDAQKSTITRATGKENFISCGSSESPCLLNEVLAGNDGNVTIVLASNTTITSTIRISQRRVTIWGALNIDYRPRIEALDVRLFLVDNFAQLRLRNVILVKGLAPDPRGGGAVLLKEKSSLVAEDTAFVSNQASAGDGGAIVGADAIVLLNRCDFKFNRAGMGDGGAVALSQGGILQITESIFTSNSAFFSGGAVRVTQANILFANSSFIDNAGRSGGAVAISEISRGVIHSCLFSGNEAAYGGAMYDANSRLALLRSEFHSNTAWDPTSQGIYVQQDWEDSGSLYGANLRLSEQLDSNFVNTINSARKTPFSQSCNQLLLLAGCLPKCTSSTLLPPPHTVFDCTCAPGSQSYFTVSQTQNANPSFPQPAPPLDAPVANSSSPGSVSSAISPCSSFLSGSLYLATCMTSGGYAPDNTQCVFPASRVYTGCNAVTADLPFVKGGTNPKIGNAGDGFWCSTVSRYSSIDETKKSWGYCGIECGYASFDSDAVAGPTASPSLPATTFPSSAPTTLAEYESDGEGYPWAAPRLYLAQYAGYYGSYLESFFDCETNCGGNCDISVPCTRFFAEAQPSWVCRWTSRHRLAVFPLAAVFQLTILPSNNIRCIHNYLNPTLSARGSATVFGWSALPPPIVALVAPTEISRCASKDLVLDGSGSRVLSVGGISWVRWELRWVDPIDDRFAREIDALKSRLEICSRTRKLFCVTDILPYNGRYAFALTVANAFAVTSSASVVVEAEAEVVPIIIRFSGGSSIRAKYFSDNSQQFTQLEASVRTRTRCIDDTTSNSTASSNWEWMKGLEDAPVRTEWKIVGPRELVTSIKSSSVLVPTADPSVINFLPARLQLGPRQSLPYDVTVRLTAIVDSSDHTQSMLTYNDLVVRVVETPLVLAIDDSNRTLLESEKNLTVIGRVISGGRFSQEHIEYQWGCTVSSLTQPASPATQMPCPGLSMSFVNLSDPSVSYVFLGEVRPASRYTFTFTAIGASTDRVASIVTVYKSLNMTRPQPEADNMQATNKASLQFLEERDNSRLNRDRTIRVLGSCPSNTTLDWMLIDTGFDKDCSHLLRKLPGAVVTPAGVLSDGRYTLSLTCGDSLTEGHMLFAVNSEPRGGVLTVSPHNGVVFSTTFVMRAADWIDDEGDLPLRYSFEFVDTNDMARSLAPISAWASWESFLPYGTVAVRNRAVDSLGAISNYVQVSVAVQLPIVQAQFIDWYTAASKRWRLDLELSTRSGAQVLSEIGVSIRPLQYLSQNASNADDALLVKLLAFSMMRVAVTNLDKMLMDDFSEDAQSEILNFVVSELIRFLPSRQATQEFLSNFVKSPSGRLTSRGMRAAIQAAFLPLQQTPNEIEQDININCPLVESLRGSSAVSDVNLRTEIVALATTALSCNVLPQSIRGLTATADDYASIAQVLDRVSQAALFQAIPGEDPVVLNISSESTFHTWRLSTTQATTSALRLTDQALFQPGGSSDRFLNNDNVWIVSLDSSQMANSSSIPSSIYWFGGTPWSRWEKIRVTNIPFKWNGTSVIITNATVNGSSIQVDYYMGAALNRAQLSCMSRMVDNNENMDCKIAKSSTAAAFDCECSFINATAKRRRMQALQSTQAANMLFLNALALPIGLPIEIFPPTLPPTLKTRSPFTRTPTRFSSDTFAPTESDAPTASPTASPVVTPLTILKSQEGQAWITILIILCVCFCCVFLGFVSMGLDRKDERRYAKARLVFAVMERAHRRQQARKFFTIMRTAVRENQELVCDKEQPSRAITQISQSALKNEIKNLWWQGFTRRHAWLAPFRTAYSVDKARASRVVLLFTITCGNMGMCAGLFVFASMNVFSVGIASACMVATVALVAERMSSIWCHRLAFGRTRLRRGSTKKEAFLLGNTTPFKDRESADPQLQELAFAPPRRRTLQREDDLASNGSWDERALMDEPPLPSPPPTVRHQRNPAQTTTSADDFPWNSWKSNSLTTVNDESPAVVKGHSAPTISPLLLPSDQPRATWSMVARKIPLALLGWAGAGFAVAFNASAAGLDRFHPWIQAWALTLVFDFLFVQTFLAVLRLSLVISASIFRRRMAHRKKQRLQKFLSSSNEAYMDGVSSSFRWQPRPKTPPVGFDDDLLLLDATADAASVDTDIEARELIQLIFGMADPLSPAPTVDSGKWEYPQQHPTLIIPPPITTDWAAAAPPSSALFGIGGLRRLSVPEQGQSLKRTASSSSGFLRMIMGAGAYPPEEQPRLSPFDSPPGTPQPPPPQISPHNSASIGDGSGSVPVGNQLQLYREDDLASRGGMEGSLLSLLTTPRERIKEETIV